MKTKLIFLFLLCLSSNIFSQIKVAILNYDPNEKNLLELESASEYLKQQKNFLSSKISLAEIINGKLLSEKYSLLWIHRPDTTSLNSRELNQKYLNALKDFVSSGGKLFLTLDAIKYLNALNIESEAPTSIWVNAADDGYGRKLGLHSFRAHPVFNDMDGGAYIFNPKTDMKLRQIGFFGSSIPQNGKVVAVDWSYITLKENSKLVVEYDCGNGKILAVGAYTIYSIPNANRPHLEMFTSNCIKYLTSNINTGKKYYWNYYLNTKKEPFEFGSIESEIPLVPSRKWKFENDDLLLKSEHANTNYWNVAGERVLVMGKENGGIDEIWSHPFMALRDYEIGIQEKDSVRWLKNITSRIEVTPISFMRTYEIKNYVLKEFITVSKESPEVVIHYEYQGFYPLNLVVKFKSNLRFMWPYSEKVLGGVYSKWYNKLNAFLICDKSKEFCVTVGSNIKPIYTLCGNYSKLNSNLRLENTDQNQIAAVAVYTIPNNKSCDVIFSASSEGISKSIKSYAETINNPEKIYQNARRAENNFFRKTLSVKTPDKLFNEGYNWALAGTNNFFVNTPGIGKSIVAGYSTTDKGWNGGHTINGRPGYAWYFGRDGVWSGFALLDYGDYDKVKSIIDFFNQYQDLNGKIFHELTTSGAVHYDAADSTPLYLILCGRYLSETGDIDFIRKSWTHIKKAIQYCYSTDTDNDHLIENTNVGHGWVEGGGLYTAHTEVYLAACWAEALKMSSLISKYLKLPEESKKYYADYEQVKSIINNQFWNNENNSLSFSKLKDGRFNKEKTILTAVPIYFGMLDSLKAKLVTNDFSENYFSSDWGARILRNDSQIYNPRGYHTGSVWPLFTGWSALAEYKYGKSVQGYSHIMNNLLIYKNWQLGAIEEVLNGDEYKPAGVCPQQCWSQSMVLQPIIEGMLGLRVDVLNKTLFLSPKLPANWDYINVENIKVGSKLVNFYIKRLNGKKTYYFFSSDQEEIKVVLNLKNSVHNLLLKKHSLIELNDEQSFEVIPHISNPNPGEKSSGFRIVNEQLSANNYFLDVQGLENSKYEFEIYSNGRKIRSIYNAEVLSFENSIYKILVQFDKGEKKYIDKRIVIELN